MLISDWSSDECSSDLHWIADRQSGGQILKYGTEEQKLAILPAIAAGECYISVGMSEPQAGSDLAAIQTKASRTAAGLLPQGRKIWSTGKSEEHTSELQSRMRTSYAVF